VPTLAASFPSSLRVYGAGLQLRIELMVSTRDSNILRVMRFIVCFLFYWFGNSSGPACQFRTTARGIRRFVVYSLSKKPRFTLAYRTATAPATWSAKRSRKAAKQKMPSFSRMKRRVRMVRRVIRRHGRHAIRPKKRNRVSREDRF
jgi:hypothetical protein